MGKFKDECSKNPKNIKFDTYQTNKGFDIDDDGRLIESSDGNISVEKASNLPNTDKKNIDLNIDIPEERYDAIATSNINTVSQKASDTISVQQNMSDILDEYNDAIIDQSSFLEGSPTFVTYYKINTDLSTEDTGLGSVVELIGVESPIKYNKIIGFPIWNIEEFTANYDYDEFQGINTEIEISGIVLPNTIIPKPDERVIFRFNGAEHAFRVTDISLTNVFNKAYYRITMSVCKDDIAYLDTQVAHVYKFDFENKCFIDSDAEEAISLINKLIIRLTRDYCSNFYIEKFNSFIYNNLYDKYLHRFIHLNHVFIKKKSFMFDIHVEPVLRFTISDETKYKNSIFERVESCRVEEFINKVSILPIMDKSCNNVFSFYRDPIQEIEHSTKFGIQEFISDNLLTEDYNDDYMLPSERIIRRYVLTKSLDYNVYLKDMNDLVVEYYLKDYIQYPLVIHILNEIVKDANRKMKITLLEKYNQKYNN